MSGKYGDKPWVRPTAPYIIYILIFKLLLHVDEENSKFFKVNANIGMAITMGDENNEGVGALKKDEAQEETITSVRGKIISITENDNNFFLKIVVRKPPFLASQTEHEEFQRRIEQLHLGECTINQQVIQ